MEQKSTVLWSLAVGLVLLTVLLCAACGGSSTSTKDSMPPTATLPPLVNTTVPSSPSAGLSQDKPVAAPKPSPAAAGPEANRVIAAAKANLGAQLSVAEEEISILSFEAVEWPDASLGCPQPDRMYAQVITPGFRVVLEVEGQSYELHADGGQTVVWCEESTGETPPTTGATDAALQSLIELAREDLAQRLSIPVAEIKVLEARPVAWPDTSLGCPQPGMVYAQVLQDGLLIRLDAGGQMYFYHSSGDGNPFLCEDTSLMVPRVTPKFDEFVPPPDSEID